jgi:hypothetical protein
MTSSSRSASRLTVSLIYVLSADLLHPSPEYDLGHVPSLADFDSVLDLFTFCNIIILMNVLDFRTYKDSREHFEGVTSDASYAYDLNAIPLVERLEIAYARGRCFDMLRWFFSAYELYQNDSGVAIDGFTKVAMPYLARQASLILEYKRRALKDGLDNASCCTAKPLERQIRLCFEGYPEVCNAMPQESLAEDLEGSLAWPNPECYGVRKLTPPRPHLCKKLLLANFPR